MDGVKYLSVSEGSEIVCVMISVMWQQSSVAMKIVLLRVVLWKGRLMLLSFVMSMLDVLDVRVRWKVAMEL